MQNTSLTPQKFVFQNDFSEKSGPDEHEIAKQHAFEQGHKSGYEDGFERGQAQAKEDYENSALKLQNEYLERLLNEVFTLQKQRKSFEDDITQKAIALAQTIATKTVDHLLEGKTQESILNFLNAIIPSLRGDETLLIDVHKDLLDTISEPITKALQNAGKANTVTFISSNALRHKTDISISWANGSYERNREEVEALISEKIAAWLNAEINTSITHTTPNALEVTHEHG